MSGVEVLKSRSNKKIIEQRYIDRVLQESATDIFRAQDKAIARFSGSGLDDIKANRSFKVTTNNIEFTHSLRQRFVDMRRVRGVKQKAVQLHNKVIYTHFNGIIRKLAYGFTQDIKNEIAQELNIVI
ncbi:MAG: hypothetical protein HRT69_17640 [Flavobacteriaceae bacterium]|nr:hypothetical protein [Flavobacteriaceae bacterium]